VIVFYAELHRINKIDNKIISRIKYKIMDDENEYKFDLLHEHPFQLL
jgi:hypothetical protein